MAQSLVQCYVHYVFSTKDRYPWLKNDEYRGKLHAFLVGICSKNNSPSIRVGGTADHVHVACRLSKQIFITDMVRDLKRASSAWLKTLSPDFKGFHWQTGYGAFSVSPRHVDTLARYIANQQEHHLGESYQDEIRRLCNYYGIDLDEKYAWE